MSDELRKTLSTTNKAAVAALAAATTSAEVIELKQKFLGKKSDITELFKKMGALSVDEKKALGAEINVVKTELESAFEGRERELRRRELSASLENERLDVTLPVDAKLAINHPGSLHPLTRVQRELEQIFKNLGFAVYDRPEVESEFYNFESLNVPSTHPARDMQDTFWTKNCSVLGTHTSSSQVRVMEERKPPIRIVTPGRCFRYERSDATHEHTFYQMDGMYVDRKVNVGNLLYFMKTLLREVFGSDQKIRLRPGYFPFVEPGFELDIWFNGRWLELLPCGLVHPRVLEYGGLDPREWQGFAFGLGLSRLVMSRFGIDDLRHFQSGDLRFLQQFS